MTTKNRLKQFCIALVLLVVAQPALALSEVACNGMTLDTGQGIQSTPVGGEAAYIANTLVAHSLRTRIEQCPRDFTRYVRVVTLESRGSHPTYPVFPKVRVFQGGRELGWFGVEYTIRSGAVFTASHGSGFRWLPADALNTPQAVRVTHTLEAEPGVPFDPLASFQLRIENNNERFPASSLLDVPAAKIVNQVGVMVRGLWVDPAEPGWGVMMEQSLNGAVYANWHTYDESGKPIWFVMSNGQPVARHEVEGDVYFPSGPPLSSGSYDVSAFHPGSPVGKFRILFSGSDRAVMHFDVNGRSGTKHLQPLVIRNAAGAACDADNGVYWNWSQPGYALAVVGDARLEGCPLHAVFSTYGQDGLPTWFFAGTAFTRFSQGFDYTNRHLAGQAFQPSGPFFGGPHAARPFATGNPVGTMEAVAVTYVRGSFQFLYDLNGIRNQTWMGLFAF